jgi:hypothetical protein
MHPKHPTAEHDAYRESRAGGIPTLVYSKSKKLAEEILVGSGQKKRVPHLGKERGGTE